LTDKIYTEPIECEETDDKHCKEDEEEGAMQEAMQETRLSAQDASGIEDISNAI
jgi:hypothetical protein